MSGENRVRVTSRSSKAPTPYFLPPKTSPPTTQEIVSKTGIILITISDKTLLGFLGRYVVSTGIIGLYITFVFSFGRFLRLSVLGMSQRIIYEDIPNTSFVKELVDDIYSARNDREHELEETTYGELVQLYRSPEAILEKTLPPRPLVGHTNWPENGRIQGQKSVKQD